MQPQHEHDVACSCFGGFPFHRRSLTPRSLLPATDESRNLYLTPNCDEDFDYLLEEIICATLLSIARLKKYVNR
jgi:hypothetical protein